MLICFLIKKSILQLADYSLFKLFIIMFKDFTIITSMFLMLLYHFIKLTDNRKQK